MRVVRTRSGPGNRLVVHIAVPAVRRGVDRVSLASLLPVGANRLEAVAVGEGGPLPPYVKEVLAVGEIAPRGDEVVAVFRESNSLENEGPQTYPKLR